MYEYDGDLRDSMQFDYYSSPMCNSGVPYRTTSKVTTIVHRPRKVAEYSIPVVQVIAAYDPRLRTPTVTALRSGLLQIALS